VMGVKDLWQLLEPVGRRINIEALTNKQLAVGARLLPLLLYRARGIPPRSKLYFLEGDPELSPDVTRRRINMASSIHQGHAKRQRGSYAECSSSWFLPTHLQVSLPSTVALCRAKGSLNAMGFTQ
jgi:hypothetical protein